MAKSKSPRSSPEPRLVKLYGTELDAAAELALQRRRQLDLEAHVAVRMLGILGHIGCAAFGVGGPAQGRQGGRRGIARDGRHAGQQHQGDNPGDGHTRSPLPPGEG